MLNFSKRTPLLLHVSLHQSSNGVWLGCYVLKCTRRTVNSSLDWLCTGDKPQGRLFYMINGISECWCVSPACVVLHRRSQLYQHTTVHSRHLISALTPHVKTRGIINNNQLGSWVRVYRGTQALLHIPMVDPLSYFSFHPVLHDWCNEGCGAIFHSTQCSTTGVMKAVVCVILSEMVIKKDPPPKKNKQKKQNKPHPQKNHQVPDEDWSQTIYTSIQCFYHWAIPNLKISINNFANHY